MTGIPLLPSHEVVHLLGLFGFAPIRQSGTHNHLLHPGKNRLVTVPSHPELAPGTLLAILKKAGIDPDEFLKLRE